MSAAKVSNLALPPIVQGFPAQRPLTLPYAPYMTPISNYTYGADGEERRVFGVKATHIAYGAVILAVAYGAYRYMK